MCSEETVLLKRVLDRARRAWPYHLEDEARWEILARMALREAVSACLQLVHPNDAAAIRLAFPEVAAKVTS